MTTKLKTNEDDDILKRFVSVDWFVSVGIAMGWYGSCAGKQKAVETA